MQNYFKHKKKIKIKDKLCINKAKIFYELFAYNNKLFKNKLLPFGWHWLYFLDNTPLYELGEDGHPRRGNFLPPFKKCKRMFAGTELKFLKNVSLDTFATKTSEITKIENKSRNNKKLFLVHIKNIFKENKNSFLIENQKIIFVDQDYKASKLLKDNNDGYKLVFKKSFTFNNIILFRYSALTFNSHRIHYDQEYTRKKEGYKDLLVHGPLLATFALDQFSMNFNSNLRDFSFKMLMPVYVNETVLLKIYKNLKDEKNFKLTIANKELNTLRLFATCNAV